MNYFDIINLIFSILFSLITVLMALYALFGVVGVFFKKKFPNSVEKARLAVVVSARNEGNVICNLIKSVKNCDYPEDKIDVFIVAHNCTDNTAEIAKAAGAIVYEYNNLDEPRKGYALRYLFKQIERDYKISSYDGYIVLDSDNTVSKDYLLKINDAHMANKNCIITSYRNSTNFGDSIVSAHYGIFFMMANRMGARGRTVLNTTARITGTGFLVPSSLLQNGWNYYSLTEDLEMTCEEIMNNNKIVYCDEAEFFDEQPTKVKIMYKQRLRWEKGLLIVFREKALKLIKSIFKDNSKYKISIYDTLINITPIVLVMFFTYLFQFLFLFIGVLIDPSTSFSEVFLNSGKFVEPGGILLSIFNNINPNDLWFQMLFSNGFIYVAVRAIVMFIFGTMLGAIFVYILEFRRIKNVSLRVKILSSLTFPFFMICQFIIDVHALLQRDVKWDAIPHNGQKNRV